MELRLTPNLTPGAVQPGAPGTIARGKGPGGVAAPRGFADELKASLQAVSEAQNNASNLQKQVQMENPQVSLEETMVAMQKAQIGFQAALHVRNRMVQAYTDIMNMSI